METILQVRDLTISYPSRGAQPHQAVCGVSFDIQYGQVLGLVGESGCGKTSTALSILGLLPADKAEVSGCILFRGKDLLKLQEREMRPIRGAGISLVYQEPEMALCPVMRVGRQVEEILRAHKPWPRSRCRTESEALLARVGFSDAGQIARRYPHQLSGGQRQRVLLAQALACEPGLIILDEPTASLDARSREEFIALLQEVKEQTNAAMLLISHAPEVQAGLADRLAIMADGRIIEQGEVRNLFLRPSDLRTQKLLHPGAPDQLLHRPGNLQQPEFQLV
jgi:ABC-type glutathione transport system ATPase component